MVWMFLKIEFKESQKGNLFLVKSFVHIVWADVCLNGSVWA